MWLRLVSPGLTVLPPHLPGLGSQACATPGSRSAGVEVRASGLGGVCCVHCVHCAMCQPFSCLCDREEIGWNVETVFEDLY